MGYINHQRILDWIFERIENFFYAPFTYRGIEYFFNSLFMHWLLFIEFFSKYGMNFKASDYFIENIVFFGFFFDAPNTSVFF